MSRTLPLPIFGKGRSLERIVVIGKAFKARLSRQDFQGKAFNMAPCEARTAGRERLR
jgi:hypothetical protein